MLAGTAIAWPGRFSLMPAATSSQGPALRELITTLAPCSAMRSAMARPMPRDDPVITATLPVRSKSPPALTLGASRTWLIGRPSKRLFKVAAICDAACPEVKPAAAPSRFKPEIDGGRGCRIFEFHRRPLRAARYRGERHAGLDEAGGVRGGPGVCR